ncbi:MAG: hypothetical protein ABSE16_04225 [Verrucomicrobiota bacterium]|jgi:hypothetical protein
MKMPLVQISRAGRCLATLLAGVFLAAKVPAQPVEHPVENRFLLVFDTSSAMKSRVPAVQRALDTLLAGNIQGQLHAGDSIGVWTFGRDFRTLHSQPWLPEHGAVIASNINHFVSKQKYSGKTSFNVLQPALNTVKLDSQRLTVLIFCDGDGEINWAPDADVFNQIFQQRMAERKKTRQPFVVVLRAQLGHYVTWTMNTPPDPVSVPGFPPWPAPPQPQPPSPPPESLPPTNAPPLIIVGHKPPTNPPPPPPVITNALPRVPTPPPLTNSSANVKTNLPVEGELTQLAAPAAAGDHALGVQDDSRSAAPVAPSKPAPAPAMEPVSPPLPPPGGLASTQPPKPANAPIPAPVSSAAPANVPALSPAASAAATATTEQTNGVAPLATSAWDGRQTLIIAAVVLVCAAGLIIGMVNRARRADHSSLITRSMNYRGGKPPPRS